MHWATVSARDFRNRCLPLKNPADWFDPECTIKVVPGRIVSSLWHINSAASPDSPDFVSLQIRGGFPPKDGDGIAGHRLDRLPQNAPHLVVRYGRWSFYVDVGNRHEQRTTAVTGHLDGMRWAGSARGLIAVIPELWGDEDEEQDERDHHVVVNVAAWVCPVEIALEELIHGCSCRVMRSRPPI